MLVLSRRVNEKVMILTSDGPITVVVLAPHHGNTRLGFDAPPSVRVVREELLGDELEKQRSS